MKPFRPFVFVPGPLRGASARSRQPARPHDRAPARTARRAGGRGEVADVAARGAGVAASHVEALDRPAVAVEVCMESVMSERLADATEQARAKGLVTAAEHKRLRGKLP